MRILIKLHRYRSSVTLLKCYTLCPIFCFIIYSAVNKIHFIAFFILSYNINIRYFNSFTGIRGNCLIILKPHFNIYCFTASSINPKQLRWVRFRTNNKIAKSLNLTRNFFAICCIYNIITTGIRTAYNCILSIGICNCHSYKIS